MSYPLLVILSCGLVFGPEVAGIMLMVLLLGVLAWAMWKAQQ